MGFERRKRGASTGYFYASVRTPAGVKKVYVGRGVAGHQAAAAAERKRADRRAAGALLAAIRNPADEADRLAADLRVWAEVLAIAWLALTGHHRHRGQWRRRKHG